MALLVADLEFFLCIVLMMDLNFLLTFNRYSSSNTGGRIVKECHMAAWFYFHNLHSKAFFKKYFFLRLVYLACVLPKCNAMSNMRIKKRAINVTPNSIV